MKLALFDLDHTLLPIDSADGWSHFLVAAGGLDPAVHRASIRRFADDYRNGRFDVEAYLAFQMQLLARFSRADLEAWRNRYLEGSVFPQIRPEARDLVERHRSTGWEVAMVTGTHAFVAAPIAQAFGIHHLLAVQPEESGGRFTGRYVGTHTYQEGKVRAVRQWLADRQLTLEQCDDSTFFSDSINDLPLLEHVRHPVVTNGDERLRAIARQRGWPLLDLFDVARAA